MALSGSQITAIGGVAPHLAYAGFTAKTEAIVSDTVGFGVNGRIDPNGQGVIGLITISGGVQGKITTSFGVSARIDEKGQGVKGTIDDTGQGVKGKI